MRKQEFCMWFLVGSGIGACIHGDATNAIVSFVGAIIIYALATEGKKDVNDTSVVDMP